MVYYSVIFTFDILINTKNMKELDVGNTIKQIRLAKGLSQEQLAGLLGVSRQRVSQIESGIHDISVYALRRLLYVLDHDIIIIKIPKYRK